jgi:hypothetical protein
MDPLSVTASIIAVLQATSAVLSICYDYRCAIKHSPWGLERAVDEIRDLRNVLESLKQYQPGLKLTVAPMIRAYRRCACCVTKKLVLSRDV